MGQPTPPGDMPLFEGLGTEWNDIVGAIPEDRRAELAPKIKERLSAYEPLKQYEDFQKSGISPDQIGTALNIFTMIENEPRKIYEAIGQHLGITPQQAKEAVEEMEQTTDGEDPRLKTMQQQIDTLAQIAIAQKQMTVQERQAAEQDAAIEKDMNDLRKKYGDEVDEEEILMRMLHKDMTAEQAFQDYSGKVTAIRQKRPSPMIIGGGGTVPPRQIDPRKLDSVQTKNLVAQMFEHANNER